MEIVNIVPPFDAATHRRASTSTDSHDPDAGGVVRTWDVEPIPLDELVASAVARINMEAGELRARRITVTVGQEGTYIAKQAEADRYFAGDPGSYPYLDAEAAAVGSTRAEVAELVRATAEGWTALNAAIEGARRGALVAVERAAAAGDAVGVAGVFPVAWPPA